MTNLLIDIVLVGLVAFLARRRIGRRRFFNLPAVAEHSFATPDAPPYLDVVETAAPASVSVEVAAPLKPHAYMLGSRHAGGTADRMAETLAMMTGPGMCTPQDRPA